ncbi:hypothetical protein OH76DRAFT_760253 [Lentinus brumalis]|uniref:Uncharacterized protein n=1 Tax=Lentinus brumalis TaxID=2498619 RepID=A0A371DSY2_9APHY|nr:hypothetical protein OH76DRAFT_760253 [Polyporus brumalis]
MHSGSGRAGTEECISGPRRAPCGVTVLSETVTAYAPSPSTSVSPSPTRPPPRLASVPCLSTPRVVSGLLPTSPRPFSCTR